MCTVPQYNFKTITHALQRASERCVWNVLAVTLSIALGCSALNAQQSQQHPRYRHIDPAATAPAELPQGIIRLIADEDFAPFSFRAADDSIIGLTVDIARAACAELRLACEVVPRKFSEMLPALQSGEGDVIVSGARSSKSTLATATPTRPFFVSAGAFFKARNATIEGVSPPQLDGRKLGYVRGTAHGAFIEKHYTTASLLPLPTATELFKALHKGEIEVAFTDALTGSFWVRGTEAKNCCIRVGNPFLDRSTFSRGLTFIVRNDRTNLRESLDFALDRLEEKGATAKIFARYFPEPLW
jgi:polar amino acid transport system substrate-binding protein